MKPARFTNKEERPLKRMPKKTVPSERLREITCALFGASLGIVVLFTIPIFHRTPRIQQPIIAEVLAAPQVFETTQQESFDPLDDIVRKVHMLETTAGHAPTGKHIRCREKGMTNEFGYRAAENFCFPTEHEAIKTVKDWFKRSLEKRSLAASLCRYNVGTPTEDCEYYKQYLSLK